jgi:hypothetical protein
MKISPDKQSGLNFPVWYQKQIILERTNEMMAKEGSDETKKIAIAEISEVISDINNKFYLFTDAAYQIAQRLKFDEDKFDANFLSVIPNRKKVTYLMGDTFYRWYKSEKKIMVFGCNQKKLTDDLKDFYETRGIAPDIEEFKNRKATPEFDVRWYFFSIHLEEDAYSLPPNPIAPFTKDTWIEFIKMIIFTELSELETVVLEPNQKSGTRKTERYFNESKSRVVIVDSAWSKTLIKADGFLVSGHPRLQSYGERNKYRKYVWIDTYTKEGYTMVAKKLKNT